MQQIILKIGGMSCMHCAKSVEKQFMTLFGVKKVVVDLEKAQATIDYDSKNVGVKDIKEALKGSNYSVL